MDKRIIDYEEAINLTDEDYIVMDSADGGPIKIKAKYFTEKEDGENA